jgi:hypothetical protein
MYFFLGGSAASLLAILLHQNPNLILSSVKVETEISKPKPWWREYHLRSKPALPKH